MERKINGELLKWKVDAKKGPLLLYGVAGCGKTYSVLNFGKKEYKNVVYFDCFNNLELSYVFDKNSTLDKLIRGISAISLETIFKEETLIIFDNVSEKIINMIKKVFVGISSYHVIMITNDLSKLSLVKGSNIVLKKMNLVGFDEYLKYIGRDQLVDFIEDSFKNNKPMPFHNLAIEAYNDYVLIGGYPDAIVKFNETNDFTLLNSVQEKNIKIMKNRFLNIDNLIDIKRGIEIFDSISVQLLKNNKKFMYGMVRNGARSKEYEGAIKFMEENSMIIKSNRVSELVYPLSKIKDVDNFKLYFNDSGVLYKKMNVNSNRLMTNNKLLEVLYENNVISTLYQNGFNIYHYHSDGKAELDVVIQTRKGKVIPIELVKEDFNTKSKSMGLALSKYNIDLAIRFASDNFKLKNNVKYVPYYAAFCVNEVM